MAKKISVDVDVDTSSAEDKIEGLGAQIRRLKKELRNTPEGTSEWKSKFNEIDDLEDKLKGSRKASADLFDTLESAGGPLGALGKAINTAKQSTVSFGAALKATGIGLLVSLIGTLTAAFAESDDEMKKFNPIIIQLQKILNGVLGAVQPLIDGFIELATQVLPYVSKAFGVVYSAVTAVFQSLGKIGSAIVKLFKGDFKGAWEDAKTSVTGFVDNYEKGLDRYEKGTEKVTKKEKELAKDGAEARKKRLDEQLKALDQLEKLHEAELEKEKQLALGLAKNEQEKLDVEMAFAKKKYDLQKKELDDKLKLLDPKKDKEEYKNTQIALAELDANRIKDLNGFNEQQKKITEDNLKAQKDFVEKSKAIKNQAIKDETDKAIADRQAKYEKDLADLEADKEFIKKSEEEKAELRKALQTSLDNDLTKIKTDARVKALNDDLTLLTAQQKTLIEGTQAYLDNSIAIENDAYQIKLANAKDNATQIEAINIEHEQNLKDISLRAAIAEKQIQLDRLNVIAGIGGSLAQLAGKNKALAIAAIAIEKAAAIGSIVTNTQIANLKAVAASPLTFGQPWVTINTIAGVLAGAAAIASGIKAVQEINAVQIPGGSSTGVGAGGSSSLAMPSYSGGGGASAQIPTITTSGGANPATQISQTIQNANSQPLRAYVVSGDITTQQALDRRTNRGATFGLG
jgi:hypothetical protein